MFGCYRRSEAADADTYTAAIAMVLAHYSADVVKAVTDPFDGLPSRKKDNGYSGLPDVADVKAACEGEAARLARLAEYAKLPPPFFHRIRPPPAGPGAFATILVHPGSPHYDKFIARSQTADRREWRHDSAGFWVAHSWFSSGASEMQRFVPMTDERLRELYPPPPIDPTAGEGEAW